MAEAVYLHCPIRGELRVRQRAADNLTFTEEKARIDAIRFLLQRQYPLDQIDIETTLLRFGHRGRSSFRIDFAVYDRPVPVVRALPLEERLPLIRLVGEVKRDNTDAAEATRTQVKPALAFLPDLSSLGVYWNHVEQRFFYRTVEDNTTITHEGPISKLPLWGSDVFSTRLSYKDLSPSKDLTRIFDEIENALHPYVGDKSKRYAVILQLLLAKIHDENTHKSRPDSILGVQDFSAEAVNDAVVVKRLNDTLKAAVNHYQRYLPERVPQSFSIPAEALRRSSQLLAPIKILESRKDVVQKFYMKFAKNLYKWDLAQYFTPNEVVDFIVKVTNPIYGQHVKDPACGSADFLISAFRAARRFDPNFHQSVWGTDNSEQATQVAVLNMLLNGDGKTNIRHADSLESYSEESRQYDVVLCNPPFGTRIVERRWEVLRHYDLAHVWTRDADGKLTQTADIQTSQQTGILFAELCVRLTRPGGRVGIILPNGYLGNRSIQYLALREWLLRHCKLAAVVGFPRFTFKQSGADVSASAVFLERRSAPLGQGSDSGSYRVYASLLESVGWRVGDKKAVPLYKQDPNTGTLILDEANEPILEADFDRVLDELLRSPASNEFQWILSERALPTGPQAWSVSIDDIAKEPDRTMDPKRHSEKFRTMRAGIEEKPHFLLRDVVEVIQSTPARPNASTTYRYVEIQDIGIGDYEYVELRGWQLPSRARLPAKPGDIFVASIWSSAGKWFLAADDAQNMLVTTGCQRVRLKPGKDDFLVDVYAGLCSEAFRVQMRGFARGSDGLAEIVEDDLMSVVLPRITGEEERNKILEIIEFARKRSPRVWRAVYEVTHAIEDWPSPVPRRNHWEQV